MRAPARPDVAAEEGDSLRAAEQRGKARAKAEDPDIRRGR
jgi:hypothetical protein